MKQNNILILPLVALIFAGSFFSCGEDRWSEYKERTALDVWIDSVMRINYLYYNEIPKSNRLNYFKSPATFLSSLLSSSDSYSFADSILDEPLATYGFDYSLTLNKESTAYDALITYVIPSSPADNAGLKRGEWIMKIDTTYITKSNASTLLGKTNALKATIGTYQQVINEDNDTTYEVVADHVLNIGQATSIADDPIHYHTILTLNDGSKVGYLVYNSFTAGTNTSPEKYNDEIRAISNTFSNAGIKSLILDLRYNEGGSIACAQFLSTLLVPSNYLDETMATLRYNDQIAAERDTTLTFNSNLIGTGKNLDLSTLVFITTGTTSGAGEMVMNCLNGKINTMYTVGSTTAGQNVGTECIENKAARWTINPVVCTVYNSSNSTQSGGFKPTTSVVETTDYQTYLPFGNTKETLLSAAIDLLTNKKSQVSNATKNASSVKSSAKMHTIRSVRSANSRKFIGGLRVK